MSITSALFTGISGLNSNGEAMSVIGNNISNVNTTGFKQGRMLFSDALSSALTGGSQLGRGVQIQGVQNEFTQGSFETTQSSTDLAIQGDSFFVVQGTNGRQFTRAGAFTFDKNNTLVNPDGLQVQGYGIIPGTSQSNGVLGAIDLTSAATTPPQQTANVKMVVNLDSTQTTPALAWDPLNPVATSNFSTSLSVYDSQGNAHTATAYFRKSAANAWDWHVLLPDATAGSPIDGTLTFNAGGSLTAADVITAAGPPPVTSAAATTPMNITFPGGVTAAQPITFDFGVNATTQYASPSVVATQTQDGFAQGTMTKVTIDEKGFVNGVYSNGQVKKLAQLCLAKFSSTGGLSKAGGTVFDQTIESGQPLFSDAGTPGVGKILSNSLEQSNVDMAAQFVKMITTQRGYSANSKTITTADEMLQEVLGLKR